MEFNDSFVRENVVPVITKATYVLFFRRVSDAPRTLESLRASDDRCREGSSSMQELLSSLAVFMIIVRSSAIVLVSISETPISLSRSAISCVFISRVLPESISLPIIITAAV